MLKIERRKSIWQRVLAVRVDDRLIHGQVVTQWVKVFKAQKIVVIDNNVAKDKMQKNVLNSQHHQRSK